MRRQWSEAKQAAAERSKCASNTWYERASACLLSAVAGYVDTAGCLALFGIFPSHVTGDIVSVGALAVDAPKDGVYARIAMLPLFMLSVAFATLISRRARTRGRDPLSPLLVVLTFALVLFCATGTLLEHDVHHPDSWAILVIAGTAVVAMGIQNALMREALAGLVPTTVMTGNLTQFTINLVELWLSTRHAEIGMRKQAKQEARTRLLHFGAPLLGFGAGVVLGGLLTGKYGLFSIALPAAASGVLASVAILRTGRAEHTSATSGVFRALGRASRQVAMRNPGPSREKRAR